SDEGLGMRLAAALFDQLEASTNLLVNPGDYTLLSGRLHLFPEIAGLETLAFDLEYALHFGDAFLRHALNLNTALEEGPHSLSVGYRQVKAGYHNAAHGSSRLDVQGEIGLSDAPTVSASARLRQEARYEADGPFASMPERYSLRLEGALRGSFEGISTSLGYDNLNDVRNEQGTSRQRNVLRFGVGLPLTAEVDLQQSLGWQREQRSQEEGPRDTLLYNADLGFLALEGDLNAQLELGYDLQAGNFSSLTLGAGWLGLVTDTFTLYVNGSLHFAENQEYAELSGGGFYQLEDGQALDFDALLSLHRELEPLLQVTLGYSLPIEVPLGHQ
ncbi:MAG: hypothetical protein M3498_03150, partial [Deinococcota bacterium]|nr:hypothetical protein [Deinococcota bacterium]